MKLLRGSLANISSFPDMNRVITFTLSRFFTAEDLMLADLIPYR